MVPIDRPTTLSKSKSLDTSETTPVPVIMHEMPSTPKSAAPAAKVSTMEGESDLGALYEGSTSTGIAQVLDRESVENAHQLPRAELFSDVIRRSSSHNHDGDDEYDEEDVPPPPLSSPHGDHVLVAQVSEHSSTSEGNVPVASVLEAPGSRRRGSSSAPVDVTVVCVTHAHKGEILTKYPSTGFLQKGSEKWVALSESSKTLEWGSVKARFTGKMSSMLSLRVAVSIFPRPPNESKKQERSRSDWHHSFCHYGQYPFLPLFVPIDDVCSDLARRFAHRHRTIAFGRRRSVAPPPQDLSLPGTGFDGVAAGVFGR